MAINYFENLGFGNFGEKQQAAAMNAQAMRGNEQSMLMNDQAMKMNESNMQRQVKADEQKLLQFKDEQQKQRAAQGAGAFYQRLQAGDTNGALQIASQYQDDINTTGDPSFTVDSVAQLMQTPQGVEQLKQMSLGMVQMAAGPEQFARFTAQQAKPEQQQQAPVSVQEQQYYEQLKKADPQAAEAYGRKAGFITTGREQAETQNERDWKQYQALKKQDPESAKQFGQAAGFISKEGKELSAQVQKRLSEFNDAAVESGRLESKYLMLADEFDKSGIEGGLLGTGGTWRETAKELTGNQDELSELRKEYAKMRGSEVVKNLPPGAASDADVAMALSAFPTDKANAKQVSSFLRGVAKLKAFEREYNEFRSSYISETGSERGMIQEWKAKQAELGRDESSIMKEYGL